MSVSAAQQITRRCADRNNGPIEEATTIYQGTLCFFNAAGYVDDDIAAGVNKFAGVAVDDYDNSAGADGDLQAEFFSEGLFALEGTGFTQGTVGSDIYATDNFTVQTSSSSATYVGRCVGYISSTKIWVRLDANNEPGNLSAVDLDDGEDVILGTGDDAVIRWSAGDASNHTMVIGLGDSNQALHVTDKAAVATDWNVSADTHPTLYLHSNTTPATDYLAIGGHDGTTAGIDVVGGTTLDLRIAGSDVVVLTATAMTFAATCFPVLPITDTDGTVEGSIWYDASEDKLKFKTGAGVETVTSS